VGHAAACRFLKDNTIRPRLELVRRFAVFTNQYPWQWEPAEAEAFITRSPVAVSTARNYQNTLRLFCGYASDARYGWVNRCLEQFGSAPRQILDEWNTVGHVTEFEGQPHRRPLTYDEVQALFDAADGRVEEIRSRGRKGALAAQRDAALLKVIYAFGLRPVRRGAWISRICGTTRRRVSSPSVGRCSCGGVSRRTAVRRSGGRC
jgi:integrase